MRSHGIALAEPRHVLSGPTQTDNQKESTVARKTLMRVAIALAAVYLLVGQGSAFADDILDVNINTSSLGSLPGSEVFFILTGTGANTAAISNVLLGGGSPGLVDLFSTTGGTSASDSLASAISLNDSADFLTVFAQSFSAGGTLSFLLDLTPNIVSPTPDQFSIEIADPNSNLIPTSDPTGFDNLFTINVDSPNPTTNIYSNLVTVTTVPEPSTLLLLAAGLGLLLCIRRRCLRSVAQTGKTVAGASR